MEQLNELLPSPGHSPTSNELEKKCRSENAQAIWALTSKLIAELVAHGSVQENDDDLTTKQKMLCEKLAGRNPDHVAAALKYHEQGDADRAGKRWFPHISDLIPTIDRLERSERAAAEMQRRREQAWYSGKDRDDFVEAPIEVRQRDVAVWRNRYRGELEAEAETAEYDDLTPEARERKALTEARANQWRDSENDPPESIARIKKSLRESEWLRSGAI